MGGHLRVLSTNLWWGRVTPEDLQEVVRETRADVVVTQELWAHQAEALSEVLPHGFLAPSTGAFGYGIALRHPGAHGSIRLPCRDAAVARLTPADWPQLSGPVEIVNVHIAAPHMPYTWLRMWRHRQMKALTAYLDGSPDTRRAVLGDFNSTPVWPVYKQMAARLTDAAAFHAERAGTTPRRTWPRWAGSRRFIRIDHCFSGGLDVGQFEVVEMPGSDHCAVLAEFDV